MSKQQRQIKHTNLQAPGASGQQFEHTEVFDDNLLPDANEISKLHEIDPGIMQWLKDRAEKEQDFRHSFNHKRLDIIGKNEANNRALNIIGMICAFFLFGGGLCFSAFLISKGCTVTATIFSGVTLISAAGLFITRKAKENKNQQAPVVKK